MFCVHCGRQLPESGYCVCGALQPGQAPQPEPVVAAEPEPVILPEAEPIYETEAEPERFTPAEPVWEEVPPQNQPVPPVYPVYQPPVNTPPVYRNPYAQPVNNQPVYPAYQPPVNTTPVYQNPYEPAVPAYTPPVEEQPIELHPAFKPASFDEPETIPPTELPVDELPMDEQPVYTSPVYTTPEPVYTPPVHTPPEPVYTPPVAPPSYALYNEQTPAQAVLSRVAGSPLFMAAAIVLSVQFVVGIVSTILSNFYASDIWSLLRTYMSYIQPYFPDLVYELDNLFWEIESYIYTAQRIINFATLPAKILPALTIAALWITFITAKRSSTPSTAGLTILQVMQVFAVIGSGFLILGILVVCVVLILAIAVLVEELSYYGGLGSDGSAALSGALIAVVVIIALAVLAGVVLNLLYNIKLLSTVKGAKQVIREGRAEKTASMFVVVWNFILAATQLTDAFSLDLATTISTLCTAAGYVLFALCILKYNEGIKPLVKQQNTFAAPPVQPAPRAPYGY